MSAQDPRCGATNGPEPEDVACEAEIIARAELSQARAQVSALLAERDEARARANEAARLSAAARDQNDDDRRLIADLREQIAIVDESRTEMIVIQLRLEEERDEARARRDELLRQLNLHFGQRDPVVDAARALRAVWFEPTASMAEATDRARRSRHIREALVAAVDALDQMGGRTVAVSTQDAPSAGWVPPADDQGDKT